MNRFHTLLRRRPLMLVSSGAIGCLVTNASYVEWYSEHYQDETTLPRNYDSEIIANYWERRPISVVRRLTTILSEMCPIVWSYYRDFKLFPVVDRSATSLENVPFTSDEIELQQQHAKELRQALTRLGPLFIKLGQQLSIRPDIIPPASLKELQRLCDSVEPVSDEIAFRTLKEDLGDQILNSFSELNLVASASLVSSFISI